jgi:sialate O-acetylesterase
VSSVGYFFGKKLNRDLNVPIGLVFASWSGSPAEAWTPENLVVSNEALKASADKLTEKPGWPVKPGVIYNSMIAPIVPYRIAGAIWYQGESNTAAPSTYKQLMETLIGAWRKDFRHEFPFYYVQIAPYSGYKEDKGVQVREQQVDMLKIPRTGMIVTSDLVDKVEDIHPQYKKPVGERLANVALGDAYHKKDIAYLNPLYKSFKVEKNKIVVSFENVPNGLIAKGGALTDFEIAGDDKKFYPAQASIVKNTVIVSAKEVKSPKAVRFAWSNTAMPNLFSKEGLPVSSFRSEK